MFILIFSTDDLLNDKIKITGILKMRLFSRFLGNLLNFMIFLQFLIENKEKFWFSEKNWKFVKYEILIILNILQIFNFYFAQKKDCLWKSWKVAELIEERDSSMFLKLFLISGRLSFIGLLE